jgi:glycosyltransferase involved in cell wall biosynthesis
MLTVLINAYAVGPKLGSEPGMGWNWICNIAKYCNVHVITEGEWKSEIDDAIQNLPYGFRMHFHYLPVSTKVREICWNQGDWRFYYYYHQWQKRALSLAKDLCKNEKINILHQLNMIGYREPGLLWKIDGIPFIWGPVGGFGSIPFSFLVNFGVKGATIQFLKNFINKIQIFQPNIYKAIKRSNIILGANSESKNSLEFLAGKKVFLLNETGARDVVRCQKDFKSEVLKLIWVGKFDNRKALFLILKAMERVSKLPIELHVIGVDRDKVEERIKNISQNVYFHSWMPHDKVQNFLQNSHVLVFSSLSEGTPHVVVEALSKGVPVICHDICGQGDVVDDSCGIKFPAANPSNSINFFHDGILKLYKDRDFLSELSNGAYDRAVEISWESKTRLLLKFYESLTNEIIP